ncbi:hypothetical protein L6R49_10465 [Myxococcota bacterium]|nr:hypothetical protein [Myxococcota bacterium]
MLLFLLILACAPGVVAVEPLELTCPGPTTPDQDSRALLASGVFVDPGAPMDLTIWRHHSPAYQEFLQRWATPAPVWEVMTEGFTDEDGELLVECAWDANARAFSYDRFLFVW